MGTKLNSKIFSKYSRLKTKLLNYFSTHGKRTERAYDIYVAGFYPDSNVARRLREESNSGKK